MPVHDAVPESDLLYKGTMRLKQEVTFDHAYS
jgi:hypothetical protein